MKCKRCGSELKDGLLACLHCVRVAQVMRDRDISKRGDELWFKQIHEWDNATLWIQVEKIPGLPDVHHFAQDSPIDFATISFCGLNMSIGHINPDHRFSGGGQQRPDFKPDPMNCPLCWDRLINRGGGICAGICLACGGKDEGHEKGCYLRMPEPGEKLPCEMSSRRKLSDEIRDMRGF